MSKGQDQKKEAIQNILTRIQAYTAVANREVRPDQVDPLDLEAIVVPNICKIIKIYNMTSSLCK